MEWRTVRDAHPRQVPEEEPALIRVGNTGRAVETVTHAASEEETILERVVKERKLVALMVGDLGISGTQEPDVVRMNEEIGALPDTELDRMLAERLKLQEPVSEKDLEEALVHVQELEISSSESPGGFTGAPDMSHEARPEERE